MPTRAFALGLLITAGAASAQEPAPTSARLLSTEASAGLTGLGEGYGFFGGQWGDFFLAPTLEGRLLLEGFTLDGSALLAVPLAGGGARFGANLTVRAGYTGTWWTVVAGPTVQWAPVAPSVQLLPSIHGEVSFGRWGLSAGLFDLDAQAIAQVSAELGNLSIGFVAPLGLTARLRVPVADHWAVDGRALFVMVGNTRQGLLTLTAVWSAERTAAVHPSQEVSR